MPAPVTPPRFVPWILRAARLVRLAPVAALALTAAASAQSWTAAERQWLEAQRDIVGGPVPPPRAQPIANALAEWRALSTNDSAAFEQLAAFLIHNPDWPGSDQMRNTAERAIAIDSFNPGQVMGFFAVLPPRTAPGALRHALALAATGHGEAAAAAARRAWLMGIADPLDEARLRRDFGAALTAADHDARMDRLLWQGSTAAAGRQLALVSPGAAAMFAARLALRTRTAGAAAQASAVEAADPGLLRRDAGYIHDKAIWLRGEGRPGAAQDTVAAPRQLDRPPTDASAWLKLLLANARAAERSGDDANAYRIASQLGDAVAADVAVRTTSLRVRDDYTSLAWLAARIAHRQLGRPADAARAYRLYGEAARSASTRSKGFYWAGRAAEDARDAAGATAHFTDAAGFADQFYGILARERLGLPQPRSTGPSLDAVTPDDRAAFAQHRLVQAARLAGASGGWREQSQFLRALTNWVTTPAQHQLAGALAAEIARPDLGVMIGRSAQANSLNAVAAGGFPLTAVPDGHQDNWTFIHAITRQESQFDPQAISHAGARGLMQLMPPTAREVAGKLGLGYRQSGLLDDKAYNITLGSTYFQQMLRYYGGSYPLAAAAYNAGPGNVNRWLRANGDPRGGGVDIIEWIENIPIFETRNYVHRVLENAVVYDTLHPDQARTLPAAPLSRYLGKSPPG